MVLPPAAYWVIVIFVAAVGGSVGSFLNVVVYRLPNGLSLISPPSHCPKCKEPIRWYDNVPVFGWLMLAGHCRHCRCWIPIRYPLIEAITAAIFVAVALVEDPLSATYLSHVVLLCTLLCAALIEIDGNRPPRSLFLPSLAVGIVVPLVWPIKEHDLELGLAAGVIAGGGAWLLAKVLPKNRSKGDSAVSAVSTGLPLALVCIGIVLGWLGLTTAVLVTSAVYLILWPPCCGEAKFRVPPTVWLLIATLAWLLVDSNPFVLGKL
jgi:leader peptidase (prepilin peptidase) / N-methyltransferase